MSTELVAFERSLELFGPKFKQVIGEIMPVERFMRTLIVSCEREDKLLKADRQSLMNAAMTGAVLGLEADGVTGQFFLLPFRMTKEGRTVVQPVIGYKGFNTLGARANLTIAGGVVREKDEFDWSEGSNPFVRHKRNLGAAGARIIAAWATATSRNRPPIVKVLSIADILAVKAKSPRGSQPPWSDNDIGFPAMAEKTAKRRLARDLPLTLFVKASHMEETFEERGLVSYIHPEKGVTTLEGEIIAPNVNDRTPTMEELTQPRDVHQDARMAAIRGRDEFTKFWKGLKPFERSQITNEELESLKQAVEQADGSGGESRGSDDFSSGDIDPDRGSDG